MEKDNIFHKKKRLLESLTKNNLLKDQRLHKAFMEVPLEEFIPEKFQDPLKLYEDIQKAEKPVEARS